MGRRWDWGFGLDEVGTSSALLVSCSSGFSFYIVSRNLSTPSVTGIYGSTAQFSKSIRRRLKGNYAVLPQLKAEYSRAGPLLPHSMRSGKKCARRTARRE